MAYVVELGDKQERIRELENKIVAICLTCPKVKKMLGGNFICTVGRRRCHSRRVRRWLDEIKRLEGG